MSHRFDSGYKGQSLLRVQLTPQIVQKVAQLRDKFLYKEIKDLNLLKSPHNYFLTWLLRLGLVTSKGLFFKKGEITGIWGCCHSYPFSPGWRSLSVGNGLDHPGMLSGFHVVCSNALTWEVYMLRSPSTWLWRQRPLNESFFRTQANSFPSLTPFPMTPTIYPQLN